ncbi:MAG: PBSX family phage terminase large subunit [Candidatus Lokiarchaeota archaeon]|nr:PBSX family phage terminase large subunit [Candidatus Lokiarchaeota archaeon]
MTPMISKINKKFRKLFKTNKRYIILTGGRGSGKSFAVSVWELLKTYEHGHKTLYTRYTMNSANDSIIPEYNEKIELLGKTNDFVVTKKDIINKESGSEILFRGIKTSSGNQTANLKSIEGITTWIIDEAEELTDEDTFDKIDESVRKSGTQNRIVIILNPCFYDHWIYRRFFENTSKIVDVNGCQIEMSTHKDVCHIHTTYLDNIENLNVSFIQKAENLKLEKPNKYNHRFLGKWQKELEGLFFEYGVDYQVIPYSNIPKEAKRIGYGLDFGFNPDETAIIEGFNKENNIYLHELLYKTNLTNFSKDPQNQNTIDWHLKKFGVTPDDIIVCDTDSVNIMELRENSWLTMPARKFEILAGIEKMKSFNLFVTKESVNLIAELEKYKKFKDPLTGNYIPKPDPKIRAKHCIDAARYLITTQNLYW